MIVIFESKRLKRINVRNLVRVLLERGGSSLCTSSAEDDCRG